MRIELRNIKYAAFASEETSCFQATIHIDGAKVGTVSNDGHGGSDIIRPHSVRARLDAYGLTLPMYALNGDDSGITYPQNAETIICDLLTKHLLERDVKRLTANKLAYTKPGQKGIWVSRKLDKATLERKVEECRALVAKGENLPGAELCLNVLPMAQAIEVYKANAS